MKKTMIEAYVYWTVDFPQGSDGRDSNKYHFSDEDTANAVAKLKLGCYGHDGGKPIRMIEMNEHRLPKLYESMRDFIADALTVKQAMDHGLLKYLQP